jgi:hypothetical protein
MEVNLNLPVPKIEIKFNPEEDLAKSKGIVNSVRDNMLSFDDYNYAQVNEYVGRTLKTFKSEY